MPDSKRSRFRIVPIGSEHTGWGLYIDGVLRGSNPSMIPLAAYVDAVMAGANEDDANYLAKAVAVRPWPTYEEVMKIYTPTGPMKPSKDPFRKEKPHDDG